MAEGRKPTVQPLRVTFSRAGGKRLQIAVHTLDPTAVPLKDSKSLPRFHSEPHTHRPKLAPKRAAQTHVAESDPALVIQASQPTLLQIAQVLTAREQVVRSPEVLEKYNRHVHLPLVRPDSPHKDTTVGTTSDAHSVDSNEQNIDLCKFVREKPVINLHEVTIDAVFDSGEESPLTAVRKAFELRGGRRGKGLLARSYLSPARCCTPKPSLRSNEKLLVMKSIQPHRLSVEQNALNRIRWMQKHKTGLRPLVAPN